jgi:hypothetical protein
VIGLSALFFKSLTTKINVMEGKIVGIILSILGIAGLVLALAAINGSGEHVTSLLAAGVGGAGAFFAGIWLVDHKRAKAKAGKPSLIRVQESSLQQQ